jgi:hypothetical protein
VRSETATIVALPGWAQVTFGASFPSEFPPNSPPIGVVAAVGWLTDSFEQYSVAWIVISAFVGGVIGSATKFLFEDVFRPRLGLRRDAKAVLAQFTTPLLRSGETLERQINNFVRNADEDWYRTSDYYRLSTLYSFAEYLAWVRLIERRLGFIAIEHSRGGRRLDKAINGLFRAISSFHYFHWTKDEAVADSAVPRRLFTAMGEVSIVRPDGDDAALEFSEFCLRYVNDQQFQRWFHELDEFLVSARDDPFRWDRLIAAGANLRILVRLLGRTAHVGSDLPVANLDRLRHAQVRAMLDEELAKSTRRLTWRRPGANKPARR